MLHIAAILVSHIFQKLSEDVYLKKQQRELEE